MNKNVRKWAGAACLFAVAVSAQAGKYTFKVTNPVEGAKLTLTWNADGTEKTVALTNGEGVIEVNGFNPQYVQMKYGRSSRTLFLEPDKDLQVSFDGETFYKNVDFAGDNAAVNRYLNTTQFAKMSFTAAKRAEDAFLHSVDSVYQANMDALNKAQLPENFTRQEQERLKYASYALLPLYQNYYKYLNNVADFTPSDTYYAKLQELSPIDASLMSYPEYREFITNAVYANVLRMGNGDMDQQFMDYLTAHVKEPKVLEHVTDAYIYDKVSRSGVDGAEALIDFYHKNVKDPALTKRFDETCTQWEAVKAGQPSPTFTCPDINGKSVSLADLKGKYVLLSFWASYDAPSRMCNAALSEAFRTASPDGVEMVSISFDEYESIFKETVRKDQIVTPACFVETEGEASDLYKMYQLGGGFTNYLLDENGIILAKDISAKDILAYLN